MYNMLLSHANDKKNKAMLSLDLLCYQSVGIGDHSTEDFYKNAIEAIENLTDAEDEILTIQAYFDKKL